MTTPAEQWLSDLYAKKRAEEALDRLMTAARAVVEAWHDQWDCSMTPGHPGMDAPINALRTAVEGAEEKQ